MSISRCGNLGLFKKSPNPTVSVLIQKDKSSEIEKRGEYTTEEAK